LAFLSFLDKDFEKAKTQFKKCLAIAKDLDAARMRLDCLLCLAYIALQDSDWKNSQDFFNEAYFVARQCSEVAIAEKCLCNAGIASANI
jgi:hypothetical protein